MNHLYKTKEEIHINNNKIINLDPIIITTSIIMIMIVTKAKAVLEVAINSNIIVITTTKAIPEEVTTVAETHKITTE